MNELLRRHVLCARSFLRGAAAEERKQKTKNCIGLGTGLDGSGEGASPCYIGQGSKLRHKYFAQSF